MKLLSKLASFFGWSRKSEKYMAWIIICKRKTEYTSEGMTPETFVCGSLFGTEYEAKRHKESLEGDDGLEGYEIIDIVPIETTAQITVAKYDYRITPEHKKISVVYESLANEV